MIARAARLLSPLYLRYVAASAGALAIDLMSFLALIRAGIAAAPASAIGYSLGIAAHWLFSSRAVFHSAVAAPGLARQRQQASFPD